MNDAAQNALKDELAKISKTLLSKIAMPILEAQFAVGKLQFKYPLEGILESLPPTLRCIVGEKLEELIDREKAANDLLKKIRIRPSRADKK